MTKPSLSRRRFLGTAAVAGAALAAPALVRKAGASSGEINVMMWSDYLPDAFKDAFKAETGISINHTPIGSNEEIINNMRTSRGRGFDLVSPTNPRSLQWEPLELLQPFDMARVPVANLNPALVKIGEEEWNFGGKGSHWLPQLWGTEAIAWRTDQWSPKDGVPSYGDLWAEEMKGKMMGRTHSLMLTAGLYLETTGDLEPGAMRAAYKDEATMRPIWQKVTDWTIARKSHVKKLWNDADGQKTGFLNEGVTIGQTWDGPILAMKAAGDPVTYQAPKEGALAWVDGLSLPIGAENLDGVYAFLEFSFRPENGGLTANLTGYNSCVVGADAHLTEVSKKNFAEAYPGEALANLWPWPREPEWYAGVRTEYADRFQAS